VKERRGRYFISIKSSNSNCISEGIGKTKELTGYDIGFRLTHFNDFFQVLISNLDGADFGLWIWQITRKKQFHPYAEPMIKILSTKMFSLDVPYNTVSYFF